ncbi:hypothetical protein ACFE04_018159 [Oxalis oulophora]
MATRNLYLHVIIILSLTSLSFSITDDTILAAADHLSNSGYNSMGLTLLYGSDFLIPPQSHSITIFSPSDHAFSLSGQPSLSLLNFHSSPSYLPLKTLKSLRYGSIIPTLSPNHNLTVTSKRNVVSINDVVVCSIYDNGSLVIYGIDEFLDPFVDGGIFGGGVGRCDLVNVVMEELLVNVEGDKRCRFPGAEKERKNEIVCVCVCVSDFKLSQ